MKRAATQSAAVFSVQDKMFLIDSGATVVQILDDPGIPEIPGESEH